MWQRARLPNVLPPDIASLYGGTAVSHASLAATPFTEFGGASNRRLQIDLSLRTLIQMWVGGGVNGSAGTVAEMQYSLDGGSVWATLATCPATAMVTANAMGTVQTIPAAARRLILARFGMNGGNGSTSPTVGHMGYMAW